MSMKFLCFFLSKQHVMEYNMVLNKSIVYFMRFMVFVCACFLYD